MRVELGESFRSHHRYLNPYFHFDCLPLIAIVMLLDRISKATWTILQKSDEVPKVSSFYEETREGEEVSVIFRHLGRHEIRINVETDTGVVVQVRTY